MTECEPSNETVDQVANNASICIKVMDNIICGLPIIIYNFIYIYLSKCALSMNKIIHEISSHFSPFTYPLTVIKWWIFPTGYVARQLTNNHPLTGAGQTRSCDDAY